jgi:Kef-type K+ transport system membrane component KefB
MWALGWSTPAMILLGALLASHTLIVYPTLREAGLGDTPAVASAVGATVLTDTLALIVLAVVAGSQTDPGSTPLVIGKIALGFVVLGAVGLAVLPRAVDAFLRRWGADRVSRYLVMLVALLLMAMLAQAFGIEGIVGAFFAGLALNRLVPNESPSMEQVEFFGTAVFVPIFLVSIGLLLDPWVMFTGEALQLAALICAAALGGKAIACWVAGAWLGFTWPERAAMYVLTTPQAAATLAVTLIGFEIGLFGTTVVNAVLVLILVSIFAFGARVLVVAPSSGPSAAAVRAATLLARPDGGRSDLVIAREPGEPALDSARLRAVRQRISRHGFDGHVRSEVAHLPDAVARALVADEHSVVPVDDPDFQTAPGSVPLLVVGGAEGTSGVQVLGGGGDGDDEGSGAGSSAASARGGRSGGHGASASRQRPIRQTIRSRRVRCPREPRCAGRRSVA